MSFGKYAIVDEVVHHFEKEPDWTWTIKPVTSGMELEMSKFLAHRRMVLDRSGERVDMPPTSMEIAFREIAMTFGGTTIPKDPDKPVADGGEPIIKDNASVGDVEQILRRMPPPMMREIWSAVGKSYPFWGPVENAEDSAEPPNE
jgi:hypothetical protein